MTKEIKAPPGTNGMTIDELRRCRLIFMDGVWKLKTPDGTVRDATQVEVNAILPKTDPKFKKLKKDEQEEAS